MNEEAIPQGEFHHFQLVNSDGDVPLSISVLVHYNNRKTPITGFSGAPISANDIISFHESLKDFDGDYSAAFQTS